MGIDKPEIYTKSRGKGPDDHEPSPRYMTITIIILLNFSPNKKTNQLLRFFYDKVALLASLWCLAIAISLLLGKLFDKTGPAPYIRDFLGEADQVHKKSPMEFEKFFDNKLKDKKAERSSAHFFKLICWYIIAVLLQTTFVYWIYHCILADVNTERQFFYLVRKLYKSGMDFTVFDGTLLSLSFTCMAEMPGQYYAHSSCVWRPMPYVVMSLAGVEIVLMIQISINALQLFVIFLARIFHTDSTPADQFLNLLLLKSTTSMTYDVGPGEQVPSLKIQ